MGWNIRNKQNVWWDKDVEAQMAFKNQIQFYARPKRLPIERLKFMLMVFISICTFIK